jgi:hypothetical protein
MTNPMEEPNLIPKGGRMSMASRKKARDPKRVLPEIGHIFPPPGGERRRRRERPGCIEDARFSSKSTESAYTPFPDEPPKVR